MKTKNNSRNIRKQFIRQFYKNNEAAFIIGVLTTIAISFVSIVFSYVIQQIIDTIAIPDNSQLLLRLAILVIGIIVITIILCVADYIISPRFSEKAMRQYKTYAFDLITKKSISSFTEENTSTYLSALSNDANTIENGYLASIFSLIQNIVWFVGSFALMLWYSPLLTLIAIGSSLIPIIASLFFGNKIAPAEKKVSTKNESFISSLKDALSGFAVIKSFKAEKEITDLFKNVTYDTEYAKRRRNEIQTIVSDVGMIAGVIAQMAVFLLGAYFAGQGNNITPGIVMAFVQLMGLAIMPIRNIPPLLAKVKSSLALVDKIADTVATNVRDSGQIINPKLSKAISVNELSFAYDEDKPILKNVSAEFEANKSYAIVGASGSGKSTLLNLMMASNNDYDGQILYDTTELRDINTESLYDITSLVQQNVFVFNSSIRDNITMFRDFDEAEVDKAIELSGLSALIEERGADYLCGENGNGLSGGERQRISIARALLRKTPVLLVDEATASLDSETAFRVTDSILKLDGYTRIVVTHSLEDTLLRRYHEILVFKNGEIVETGRFDDLMNQKGYFYSLYTVAQ